MWYYIVKAPHHNNIAREYSSVCLSLSKSVFLFSFFSFVTNKNISGRPLYLGFIQFLVYIYKYMET